MENKSSVAIFFKTFLAALAAQRHQRANFETKIFRLVKKSSDHGKHFH